MIKEIIVTFQYDSETDTVTNVKCTAGGVEEKKKRTTKKKEDIVAELEDTALITLESSKLAFNNKAVADMNLKYEDRVIIKWEQKDKTLFPIIGKDTSFDEEGNGNKVTKTNTVGYKGKQNVVLAEMGDQFTIEPYVTKGYPEGVWRLLSTTSTTTFKTLEETIKASEKEELDIIVEDGDESEITEMTFKL
jgi:hypothetical protein